MQDLLGSLQRDINRRQEELNRLADLLARRAKVNTWVASSLKVALVFLGAISATKAAADVLLGTGSVSGTVAYSALGVLTAAIAGISATFDFDHHSIELTQLAAEAWATLREVDSSWRRSVSLVPTGSKQRGALTIIAIQDAKLADIQGRAARLGINVALDIPELLPSGGEHGPYAA